nr:troponin I, cardiac muscle-like isoform X2 [Misgurnus anguillicaudatus]
MQAKFKVTTARPLGLIMSAICRPHFTISFLVLHPKLNRLDCLSRTTGTLQGFASHIDVIDEERYDTGVKAAKNEKEMWSVLIKIQEMNQKIYEMKSRLKRPNPKRVKLDFKNRQAGDVKVPRERFAKSYGGVCF